MKKSTRHEAAFRNVPTEQLKTFSQEDIDKLWQAIDAGDEDAEIAMIYIYTGLRPVELFEIKKENVDLTARIMVGGGKKTAEGQNRHIPLHQCIMPFVKRLMQTDGEFLIMRHTEGTSKEMEYLYFLERRWKPLMERLGLSKYSPHYGRRTCLNMLRKSHVAGSVAAMILGDKISAVADSVLVAAIDTISGR